MNINRGYIVLPNNPTKKNMSELNQYVEFLKRKIKLEFPDNKDIRMNYIGTEVPNFWEQPAC